MVGNLMVVGTFEAIIVQPDMVVLDQIFANADVPFRVKQPMPPLILEQQTEPTLNLGKNAEAIAYVAPINMNPLALWNEK